MAAPGFKVRQWWLDMSQRISWRLQPLLLRAPGMVGVRLARPESLFLKLTLRCSARCRHCDMWKHPSKVQEELSTEEWKSVIRSLRRWLGPRYLSLTGGEVLLRPDALELLQYAVGQGFRVELLTNGYAMTDELAGKIMAIGPGIVAISLDAMNAALYDRLRGREGFFERATAALRQLVHHHQRLGSSCQVVVKTVIMDPNLDELTKIVDWVAELGTARVMFQPITQNYEQEMRHDWYQVPELNELWVKDAHKAAGVIDELIARAESGAPIANTRRSLEAMKAYFLDPEAWSRNMAFHIDYYADKYCPNGVGLFDVGPNGDVRICPMSEPIGNVRREPPRSVWLHRPACWKRPCPYW